MTTRTELIGGRAIVVGAGMAGLLSARVLADSYEQVTIVDRDTAVERRRTRRGVPQGAHAHALLARGQQLLEGWFPGLTAELEADGAAVGDVLGDVRMFVGGHRLRSTPTGLTAISASRPFLEYHVRRLVEQLPRITFRDQCDVVGITATDDQRRVTGVQLIGRHDGSAEEWLAADAVVDASGRVSRLPAWLAALGIEPPSETRVVVDLGYASRRYRLDRGALDGDLAIVHGMTAHRPRCAAVAVLEDGTGIVTLGGIGHDRPPVEVDGFVAFAGSVDNGGIRSAVTHAVALDDPVPFRFAASTRRHFERHRGLPEGLVSVGDGFCSLNPMYAQGMTLAALEAEALETHLRRHGRLRSWRLHREVAALIEPAWEMVTGADLALPVVPGHPSPRQRLIGRYVGRLQRAAARDGVVATAFARVTGLVDRPQALFKPSLVRRVLRPSSG